MSRDEWADFEGPAANLIDEGLIPAGFKWPEKAEHVRWADGRFRYWLRRVRPAGHKGPMRSWLGLDSWRLRIEVQGRDHAWHVRRRLERKAEEFRAEVYRLSAAGTAEWSAALDRFIIACSDEGFQSFKAKVPGLVPPKRRRRLPPGGPAADSGAGAPQG